jgi:hypothetical protein
VFRTLECHGASAMPQGLRSDPFKVREGSRQSIGDLPPLQRHSIPKYGTTPLRRLTCVGASRTLDLCDGAPDAA